MLYFFLANSLNFNVFLINVKYCVIVQAVAWIEKWHANLYENIISLIVSFVY